MSMNPGGSLELFIMSEIDERIKNQGTFEPRNEFDPIPYGFSLTTTHKANFYRKRLSLEDAEEDLIVIKRVEHKGNKASFSHRYISLRREK